MHYWFSKELCWKEKQNEEWVESVPPRPEWATEEEEIPAKIFITSWAQASYITDVKKEFFWKSIEELQGQASEISNWLIEHDYVPLSTLSLRTDELLNPQELQDLEDEGWIQKVPEDIPESKTPSDQDSYLPRQHIQVTEGGDLRFSARH